MNLQDAQLQTSRSVAYSEKTTVTPLMTVLRRYGEKFTQK